MIRSHEYPVVGSWYLDVDHNDQFEIVARDEADKTIEIQYFSGEIEEVDADTWFSMRLIAIAPPKDWSGPFEVEKDEFSELGDESKHPTDWSDPLNSI